LKEQPGTFKFPGLPDALQVCTREPSTQLEPDHRRLTRDAHMGDSARDAEISEPLIERQRNGATYYEGVEEAEQDKGIWDELKALVSLCGPAVVQLCAQQAAIVSNQMFAGSLGKHELAAASLGFTVSAPP
jgi:hypothetical protein